MVNIALNPEISNGQIAGCAPAIIVLVNCLRKLHPVNNPITKVFLFSLKIGVTDYVNVVLLEHGYPISPRAGELLCKQSIDS